MNISQFIAKRITFNQEHAFTKVIIRIGITAVALAVTVLVIATSLFKGFEGEISHKIFDFWGDIHVSNANVTRTFEFVPFEHDTQLQKSIKEIGQIGYSVSKEGLLKDLKEKHSQKNTHAGIKSIYPFIVSPAILDAKSEFEGILLRGFDAHFDNKAIQRFIMKGRFIDFNASNKNIVLSEYSANRLQLGVGDALILNFLKGNAQVKKRVDVVGVYKTGILEYDKRFAFVHMGLIQEGLGLDSTIIGGYEVLVEDKRDLELLNEYIYLEELPSNLYTETIKEKFPNIFDWLQIQHINEKVLFLLMVIVSIITMITTYLILILERTRTIGVLKSMGSTDFSIIKIFLYCAFYIIVRGIIIGNLVGLFLCYLQYQFKFIQLDEANYLLAYAPIEFNWIMYIIINLLMISITLLFLIIPSFVISKITPTKVLRFG